MNANDRSITLFTSLGHGMFHTYELTIPVFVAVWLDVFATSEAVLGLVVGAGLALVGIFAPLTGVLSDTYGSKRLVMLSVLGMGVGFLLLSVSPSVVGIALALLVWGLAASLYHPAGLSLISRGVEQRGTALGYHGAAGSAGTAIGPLVVIVSLVFLDWRVVAALLFVPALVAVLFGWRIDFEPGAAVDPVADGSGGHDFSADIRSVREFLTDTRLLFTGGFVLVFLVHMGYGMYYRGLFTFLPDLLAGLPIFEPVTLFDRPVNPGRYVYSALLLVGVVGQYAGGKLSDGHRPERLLVGLLGVLAVATLAFPVAAEAGIGALLAVCLVLGFAVFLAAPITLTLVADYAAPEVHGLSYGFTYFGLFGVGAIGATGAGVVLTYADSGTLFVILAGIAVAGMVVAAALWQRY